MKTVIRPEMLVISTTKQGIETLAKTLVEQVMNTPIYPNDEDPSDPEAVYAPTNELTRFAILRALQEAAKIATTMVTEDAINEALRVDKEHNNKPIYPGAAEGQDFVYLGDRFRLMIHNEYPYGDQTVTDDAGKQRPDPNSLLWAAEQKVIERRKEDGKLSTKKLAAWEAQLRADHPRMKPTETTVSISLRNSK